MVLESDKYKVGDTVQLIGGVFDCRIVDKSKKKSALKIVNLNDGVIALKKDIPWGFNFVVQLVNTDGIFFDRGEFVEARPENLRLLNKILPK